MLRRHTVGTITVTLIAFIFAAQAVAQTPDWRSLRASGNSYIATDERESMRLRQHQDADLMAIATSVTTLELPQGAETVTSSQRGSGPAIVLATVFKQDGISRILSVSVATRNGGGALSLAHAIDPALPNAGSRLSDSGAALLMAAMQGESLDDPVKSETVAAASPPSAPSEKLSSSTARGGRRAVENIVFDLDYQYGVGGAAYPVYKLVVLFADGVACQCLEVAVDDIDVEAIRRESPERVGSWTRSGADYVVRWTGVSKPETLKVSVGPPKPLPGSSSLRGKYQSISGGGNTALGGGVISASVKDLQFFADGSFAQSNARLMQSNAAVVSGKQGKSGVWSLAGSTLALTYADENRVRTTVFYSAKRKSSADFGRFGVLWIGGEGFKRIE